VQTLWHVRHSSLNRVLVICGNVECGMGWVIYGMKTVGKTCGIVDKMWNANCGMAGCAKVMYSTVVLTACDDESFKCRSS